MAKKVSKISKAAEERLAGQEPSNQFITNDLDMIQALNYYNIYFTPYEAIDFLVAYLKEHKYPTEVLRDVQAIEPWRIRLNIMTRARMLSRGCTFEQSLMDRFEKQLKVALDNVRDYMSKQRAAKVVKIPTYTALDRVLEQIGAVEEALDQFLLNGKSDFSAYNFFKSENVQIRTINRIRELYTRILDELRNPDPDTITSLIGKRRKDYIAFVQQIVNDCDAATNTKKAEKTVTRKPRKIKEKSVDQIVRGARYLKESAEFKVASINPSSIVGAQELWCFHTKSRNLFVYRAQDGKTLSVAGSKVINVDDSKSDCRTLRKPLEVLPQIMHGSKAVNRRTMNEIRSKPKKGNHRLDQSLILLKVYR